MEHYLGVAKKERISETEIGAAQSIVMAVAAGRVNAQFQEVEAQTKSQEMKTSTG
jgi:hypothetical protein